MKDNVVERSNAVELDEAADRNRKHEQNKTASGARQSVQDVSQSRISMLSCEVVFLIDRSTV